jgi:hypothetical protein
LEYALTGLRVTSKKGSVTLELGDAEPLDGLFAHFSDKGLSLPAGCAVILDAGARPLAASDLERLFGLLAARRLYPKAIRSTSTLTLEAAKRLGFYERTERDNTAKVVHGLLRSGDVNPGGEIISAQDVFVLGSLRGNVWAGKGQGADSKALVYALAFSPLLIRIGPLLARSEDGPRLSKPPKTKSPEIALIRDGLIEVVEHSGDMAAWLERS